MNDLSIIIPVSRNSNWRDVHKLLRSLQAQTFTSFETIIVTDPYTRTLPLGSSVKKVFAPKRGASAARNFAANLAKGDTLCFLDDDVVLDNHWCEIAVETLRDSGIGGVSGKATVTSDRLDDNPVPLSLMWVFGATYWPSKGIIDVNSSAGMNFCVRKEIFMAVGGYDEDLGPSGDRPETGSWHRLGAEDSDLALKIIHLARRRVVYNPDMLVVHRLRHESLSLEGIVRRALHVGHNRAYIHVVHGGAKSSGDLSILRMITKEVFITTLGVFRHPLRTWKGLSIASVIVLSLGIGYTEGLIHFRLKGDQSWRAAPPRRN